MLSRVFRKFCGVKFWIQKPGDQVFYWEIEGDCVRLCEIVWGPLCQYSPVTYRDVLTVTQPSVVVRTHISGHTRPWYILYYIQYMYHIIYYIIIYLAQYSFQQHEWNKCFQSSFNLLCSSIKWHGSSLYSFSNIRMKYLRIGCYNSVNSRI